jgi:FrmR/RcnR family transcriptional regulator, repressor of frmRAB operon
MKFWIGPVAGALMTGAYGMFRLADQWNTGDERVFQASGTLLAYMLLGAVIGLIISGLLFSATQNEVSDSNALAEETKHPLNQTLLRRASPKLLDKAAPTERSCPVSHTIPDKTKVLDRVQRIRKQIDALQRALHAELSCADILQMLSDARGAINDLSTQLVEDYIRMHVDTDRTVLLIGHKLRKS